MNRRRILLLAAGLADARALRCAPGAVLLEGRCIIAAGTPQAIGPVADAQVIELREWLLIPALVNAHAHLDLTHIGPRPSAGSFTAFVDLVRRERLRTDDAIRQSVGHGAELARRGGTAIIGDIAGTGSLAPLHALRDSGLAGVSFLEVFGLGLGQAQACDTMRRAIQSTAADAGRAAAASDGPRQDVRLGLQPHAPYSCGLEVYRAAAACDCPLSTHLAESPEELEFVRAAQGPIARMLQAIGVWDETIAASGRHPVDHLEDALRARPWIVAHANYVEDRHIELLASSHATVAYCPRASAYFGHPEHGEHRYRDMLSAGVNVALGTDSIICLDTPDRLSVLDDMRLLYRRDSTDPATLLAMATINGAAALGLDPSLVDFSPGPTTGVLAVPIAKAAADDDPLRQALRGDAPPRWALGPFPPRAA